MTIPRIYFFFLNKLLFLIINIKTLDIFSVNFDLDSWNSSNVKQERCKKEDEKIQI